MRIVLHICCGVCAAGVVERLTAEGHEVRGFFYNPNIHPLAEYEQRVAAAQQVAQELNFPLSVGAYDAEEWFKETAALADEPEGGRRCAVCFRFRLRKTHLYLQETGGDAFTTTLTVSPSKPAAVVNQVGGEIGGEQFLPRDFKKKDGFKRSSELARQWAIYRQHYCGCVYSQRDSTHR